MVTLVNWYTFVKSGVRFTKNLRALICLRTASILLTFHYFYFSPKIILGQLLWEYQDVFAEPGWPLGQTDIVMHCIDIGSNIV